MFSLIIGPAAAHQSVTTRPGAALGVSAGIALDQVAVDRAVLPDELALGCFVDLAARRFGASATRTT